MHWDVGLHRAELASPGKVNPRVNDKIKNVVCPLFPPYFPYFPSPISRVPYFPDGMWWELLNRF